MSGTLLPFLASALLMTQDSQPRRIQKDRKESKGHRKLRLARKKKRRK